MRILLLAPGCNPEVVTSGMIGFSLAEALARTHEVTLAIRARDEADVRRANGGFRVIEPIETPRMDRFYAWIFQRIFRGDRGNILWTAVRYPLPLMFEWLVWKRCRSRILAGEFDVVLRILPIVPMMPSPMAYFLRKVNTPFVIGPLNGSLPSRQLPKHRTAAGYWASNLRALYRYLPFARSTYSRAKAIIAGSSHTYAEFRAFRDRLFYVPGENGIKASVIEEEGRTKKGCGEGTLSLVFVGRLVPLKACDLALRGAANLLSKGQAHLTILGGGPEKARLEALARDLHIDEGVTFRGWVSHADVLDYLRKADVLLFPSLRDFGAGVVFEALAKGAVPVVVDQGGPGDIVKDGVGYRVPLGDELLMTDEMSRVLKLLAEDRVHLETLRRNGIAYARAELTWERKAGRISDILGWATDTGPKPTTIPPKSV